LRVALAATPIALSASCCANFLSKIVCFNEPGNFGVPAYTMGMDSLAYDLSDGASFSVSDGEGGSETVVFQSSQFADIDQASMDEVIDAINGQLTIGHALMDTDMLMVRGVAGGPDAMLTLTDGPGSPLAALAVPAATMMGTEDIELLLDTEAAGMPMDEGEARFMHLPYFLAMSHTPGTRSTRPRCWACAPRSSTCCRTSRARSTTTAWRTRPSTPSCWPSSIRPARPARCTSPS